MNNSRRRKPTRYTGFLYVFYCRTRRGYNYKSYGNSVTDAPDAAISMSVNLAK